MLLSRSLSWLTGTLLFASGGLVACSSGDGPDSGPGTASGEPQATAPTFHKDIEPIYQRSCQSCHQAGGIAPFGLITYEEAQAAAGLAVKETEARRMPPWGAQETEECSPRLGWKNDIRLSDAEIELIKKWSEAGAPEGDPNDAPPPFKPPTNELSNYSVELAPAQPFVTEGETDQFICFVIDPKLTGPTFINGTHVIPGNSKVVHHAVLVADPDGQSLVKHPSGVYDCFGGTEVDNQQLLAVWAPGGVPFELPQNIGIPVKQGSLIVMQIHYHPAGTTADPDTTKIQLRYNTSLPEYWLAAATPIGNFAGPLSNGDGLLPGADDGPGGPVFYIPAGKKDHKEEMLFTMPEKGANGEPLPDIYVYGAAAHMHYVGTDMKVEVEREPADGQPAKECLLHEPRWDFNWQRFYAYDAPIEALPRILPKDRIRLTCLYDNSMDNPGVVQALKDAKEPSPKDVYLGEQTLNEMCLTMLPLLYKSPL
jgi:mono/diheme cytochrome c family protein